MATVKDALNIARTILGDDLGSKWSDGVLMPKVTQAHGELMAKLALNGIAITREETVRLTVLAGATLLVAQPSDMVQPISIREMAVGDSIDNSGLMGRKAFLGSWLPTQTLGVWSWIGGEIRFIGATVDRDVLIRYIKTFVAPTEVNQTLVFKQSEIFIGPRVAAIALFDKDKAAYDKANQMAETNLSTVVRLQVKSDLPVRRRPFSSVMRRR